ncbi:MAG: diphthine--ammonia ligase, partial [Nanoarchaeota archaeon]
IFSPLWHIDQEKEMRNIVSQGFEVIISSVAAYGLDESWLGKKIDEKRIESLVKLREKYSINVAGEGGEFESLVLDAPFFSKKINVIKSSKYFDKDGQGRFIIEEAIFVDKD